MGSLRNKDHILDPENSPLHSPVRVSKSPNPIKEGGRDEAERENGEGFRDE